MFLSRLAGGFMFLCLYAVLPCRVSCVSARLPLFSHQSLNFCFMLLWEVMGW